MESKFEQFNIGIVNDDLKEVIIMLLDFFSEQTDLVIALYSPDGKEVWCACEERFSPLCGFCKSIPKLWELCTYDHSERSRMNFMQNKERQLSMCHLGLWNMTYPLKLDDIYYGSLLTGQKKLSDKERNKATLDKFYPRIEEMKKLNLITDKDATAMVNCFNAVKAVDDIENISLNNIIRIEEKLIGLISNLMARVRRITLLRHEIHQPNIAVFGTLAKVIDKLENINSRVDANSNIGREFSEIIKSLKYTKNASRLFSTIIENICTALSGDDITLNINRHNIIDAIEEARGIFEIEALEKEVVLKEIEKKKVETIFIEFDKGLIMRVLINAFNNAIKYSYSGDLETTTRTINTKIWSMDEFFRIRISNYGVGITEDEISEVWEEGYRGILSSDRHRTGSGLGLYQIKLIVEAHGGSVEIVSDPVSDNLISGPYLTTLVIDLPYIKKNTGGGK